MDVGDEPAGAARLRLARHTALPLYTVHDTWPVLVAEMTARARSPRR